MSEGMFPPQPPEQPLPPPAEQPAVPPAEPFQVKARRFVQPFLPPEDPTQDTPEMKLNRALYALIAIAIVVFILCGGFYALISLFK